MNGRINAAKALPSVLVAEMNALAPLIFNLANSL